MHLVNLVDLSSYFYLVLAFFCLKLNRYFSACENLPNSSCQFWKLKTTLLQVLYQSLELSNITPLYFFSSSITYFGQNVPIKMQIFETFECSGQNSSNFSWQYWLDKSIPLHVFHHFSFWWLITYSSYIFYFGLYDPIKVQLLRLSSALVITCHIPH